jgi:hypothetical protein
MRYPLSLIPPQTALTGGCLVGIGLYTLGAGVVTEGSFVRHWIVPYYSV